MTEKIDCIVIGAGVIGLAVARRMALAGLDVIVLEAEDQIGTHSSSRNSEVIHAGIYYPQVSLKARLCVAGKKALYEYCDDKNIPYQRIGKLIVASTAAEERKLRELQTKAALNGVTDLAWLSSGEIADMEPTIVASAALLSPSTGIIDSHALMLGLHADLEACGGSVVVRSRVSTISLDKDEFTITVDSAREVVCCRHLVNAAGHQSLQVAACIGRIDPSSLPQGFMAKGHYYGYAGRSPFSHLIYPLPVAGGLGIHATNDLGGDVRFGPDLTWVEEFDYGFDESRKPDIVAAIRNYFPDIDEEKLQPSYTGIRSKISGPGTVFADFSIQGPPEHGISGLVNLFGIESPGLTSSLAIADYVYALLTG